MQNRKAFLSLFLAVLCGLFFSVTAIAGFSVDDTSDKVTDAYKSAGQTLVQKVKFSVDDGPLTFEQIWIGNNITTNPATKQDIKEILVKHGGTTLLSIDSDNLGRDDFTDGQLYDLDTTAEVKDGDTVRVEYKIADELEYISYDGTDIRKLQPKVVINGEPNGTDHEAIYRDGKSNKKIKLYPPYEEVADLSPPNGGEFNGLRLLAQRIRLTDNDNNNKAVTINPVVLFNIANNQVPEDAVEKIEIRNQDGDLLGEKTDVSGLNSPGVGVRISTLQNNTTNDDGQTALYVYFNFSEDAMVIEPDDEPQIVGELIPTTAVISHEDQGGGINVVFPMGNPQTKTWEIVQNRRPYVDFTYDPSGDLNYNTEITFTPKNVGPEDKDGDEIISYNWEFSDGTTKSGFSVTHTFGEGGNVWAKLIAEDEHGVTGEKTKSFNVTGPGAPTAEFSYDPASPKVDEEITFTDQSTTIGDADIVERKWDFGDGESVTYKDVNQTTATHSYGSSDVYQVTLTVKDSRGNSDSVIHEVTVSPMGVTAAFSVSPSSPVIDEPVTFGDQSSTVGGEDVVKWEWDFGDDTTKTIDSGDSGTTTHSYSSSGVYTVTLKATDSRGKSGTVSHDVPVSARGITADFSYDPSSPRINQQVSFTDESTVPEGSSITKWIWEFGDGNVRTIIADGAENGNTTYTYPETGTYQVTLTIITSKDLAASVIKEVVVGANPPEAKFSYSPSLPQVDEVVQFTDNSTEGDGNIVSWEWDFGDGSTSTEQNPTHAYSEVDNYQVTLTVTDEYDNTDSVSKTITAAEKGADIRTYPYPNPAGSPVTIVYYLPENTSEAHLWMIDFSGELAVHRADLDTNAGENKVPIDLSDHPNGLYFYWIKGVADGKRIKSNTLKLLVQHGG